MYLVTICFYTRKKIEMLIQLNININTEEAAVIRSVEE